jgi:D-alanyl-lipoteichoic acid acyltransferase DltB (MBOAT superfamily)
MYNFNLPFFATSPSDFWRRWHISLSQCLRDNLYIPMGGNRYGFSREAFALMATMLIGGLWHGAQWHFVLWGAYCGGLLIIERLLRKSPIGSCMIRPGHPGSLPSRVLQITVMFILTIIGFLIFRAESVRDVGQLLANLPDNWSALAELKPQLKELAICTWLLVAYQFSHYITDDRFVLFRLPVPARALLYFAMYLSISLGAPHDARLFIYFQF